MVTNRYLAVAICVVAALLVWGVVGTVQQHLSYLGDLEEFRAREFRHWVTTQRGTAHSLDRACAEVLVTDSGKGLQSALRAASEAAYAAREALWHSSPLPGLDSTVYQWKYYQHYERMGSYLYYLAQREDPASLNDIEYRNVNLIRDYAVLLHSGFDEVLARVQYESEPRPGSTVTGYVSWRRIAADEAIPGILDDLGREISLKPEVGGDDPGYRDFVDLRWASTGHEHGLLNSGEAELEEDEMLMRALSFLQPLSHGEIVDDVGNPVSTGGSAVTGRHGGFFPVGEYTRFRLTDEATGCRYLVGVTRVGGHIISLEIAELPDGLVCAEETALSILERWAELEAVSLRIVEEQRSGEFLRLSHAPVRDGIVHMDSTVGLRVSLGDTRSGVDVGKPSPSAGAAVDIDARRYFASYGGRADLRPRITAEEAIDALAPTLAVDGQPRLEARGDGLRYLIPVTGVKRVTAVYVDALTGEYDSMLYSIRENEAGTAD